MINQERQELFIMCELELAWCNGPIKTGQVRHIAVMQPEKMRTEIMEFEVWEKPFVFSWPGGFGSRNYNWILKYQLRWRSIIIL